MNSMVDVLKNRDGITENEAINEVNNARESMYDIIENGGSIDDVEDMMMCDYGLELDYIMDLLI